MTKIGITASPTLKSRLEGIEEIVKVTRELVGDVYLETKLSEMLGEGDGVSLENMEKDGVDILVTVGGDGTVLRALHHCNIPILGVNMGRVGFLNEVAPEKYDTDLKRVLEGDYHMDVHTRIKMSIDGKDTVPVLNEVVIHSSQAVKLREFEIFLDGDRLDHFRADGVIIATPTGCTGYAMSAGGPLLDPRLEGMLILPLAPFRVAKRPNVVPLDTIIKVKVTNHKSCIANLDGQEEMDLSGKEVLEFTNASSPARFMRFESSPYRVRQRAFQNINM